MRTYFDTSALAKRYVREPGTETVLKKCSEATEIVISVISVPELMSALNARTAGITGLSNREGLKQQLVPDGVRGSARTEDR